MCFGDATDFLWHTGVKHGGFHSAPVLQRLPLRGDWGRRSLASSCACACACMHGSRGGGEGPTHSLPRSSGSPAEAALGAQAQGRGSQTRCRDLTHLCVLVHGAKGLHLLQRARFLSLPTLGPR